ncbi:MAG: phage major capsid protein [Sphaerochaeta sp.]|jgi:HK97 family phage major capsid protein|nr:phage major capsid protein [Sphaerochaeta sp.]
MATYDAAINRTTADALVPVEYAREIIQESPKDSAALSLMRRVPMSSKTKSQPVLSVLPQAYWVNGDTGLKQTTDQQWTNQVITAEELAAIVVIPDALFDDANVPLWSEVKPYLRQALGRTVDLASMWGTAKPASWTTDAIIPGAIAAGNYVELGTGADIGVDVASLGEMIAQDGYSVNGFASRPGLQWSLRGIRSTDGVPIYGALVGDNGGPGLYGYPLNEVTNGSWDADTALLVAADWSKFIIGVRQDITFNIFSEGVISDAGGKVIVNLMQQDSKALRVVFRVGYVGANPITALNDDDDTRFPAAVLVPADLS